MRNTIRIPLTIEAQCAKCGAMLEIEVEYPVNYSHISTVIQVVPCKCKHK